MTKETIDQVFNAITANGMRDMDEIRFHQAANELIERYERIIVTPELLRQMAKEIDQEFSKKEVTIDEGIKVINSVGALKLVAELLEQDVVSGSCMPKPPKPPKPPTDIGLIILFQKRFL